jgi:hypothetical protein
MRRRFEHLIEAMRDAILAGRCETEPALRHAIFERVAGRASQVPPEVAALSATSSEGAPPPGPRAGPAGSGRTSGK